MNNFINNLLTTIVVVFLLVLTLFVFSLLVEYVKFLWIRHRTTKAFKKIDKDINKELDRIIKETNGGLTKEDIEKALNQMLAQHDNDDVKIDGVQVIKIDKNKKEKE